MPLDRETIFQIVVSTAIVGLFIAAAAYVSRTYSSNGGMTTTGGFALVGAIVLFILLMAGAGLWLERQEFDGNST